MRYCNCLQHNIKQECKTSLGGIDKIFLINFDDFSKLNGDEIVLHKGKVAYEIDAMRNTASFIQTSMASGGDGIYINNVLTFTMNFHSANLEDELMHLTLSYFKILIKYKNGYWRFVDDDPYLYFKQQSVVNNSGIQDNDLNAVTFTYVLNGHSYGTLFETMPTIIVDKSTDPIWVYEDFKCETN